MSDIFFKKLKELREKSPYTQQQIADKLGISIKQYQNYEKKVIPPHDKLIELIKILKYDFSVIIYQGKIPKSDYSVEETTSLFEEYREKYLTALEEIRELNKRLQHKEVNNITSLKKAK